LRNKSDSKANLVTNPEEKKKIKQKIVALQVRANEMTKFQRYEDVPDLLEEAIRLEEQLSGKDSKETINQKISLGFLYLQNLNEIPKGIIYLEQAKNYYENIYDIKNDFKYINQMKINPETSENPRYDYISILYRLGAAYVHTDSGSDLGVEYLKEKLKLSEKWKMDNIDEMQSMSYIMIGIYYIQIENYSEAINYLEDGKIILEKLGNPNNLENLLFTHGYLADCHFANKEYEKSSDLIYSLICNQSAKPIQERFFDIEYLEEKLQIIKDVIQIYKENETEEKKIKLEEKIAIYHQ